MERVILFRRFDGCEPVGKLLGKKVNEDEVIDVWGRRWELFGHKNAAVQEGESTAWWCFTDEELDDFLHPPPEVEYEEEYEEEYDLQEEMNLA